MTKGKTATMQKVADEIGVSVSTVSRIFNSSEFAKDDTRDRVMKAAARLGYTRMRRRGVSHPISMLGRNQALKNIVLLAPEAFLDRLESSDWIYQDVVPTLQRLAKKNDFHLILSSYGIDDQWEHTAMNTMNITGVLWMAHDQEKLLARISKTLPVVVLNDNSLWPPQTSVICNDRIVLFKSVDHLAKLGHKRIAFFDVDEKPNPALHSKLRVHAYHEAMNHFHMEQNPDLCILERFGPEEHPQAIARAMDRMAAMESTPTAIITSLTYSIQFLKEARARSIDVPQDLSIVAIDNAPAAEWVDPSLTVVDCVFGRCAEVAVDLLLKETSHQKQAQAILVEPKLIVRNSTAKAKSSDI
jgi:DNA-binding LacI/PurR family transcriptional regulator